MDLLVSKPFHALDVGYQCRLLSKKPEDGGDVGSFETFGHNVKITKTVGYTVSGRTLSVANGEQAVAFGRIKNGKKKWFADRLVFTMPDRETFGQL